MAYRTLPVLQPPFWANLRHHVLLLSLPSPLSSPPAPRPPFHKHTKHATASVPLYCWEHSSNSYLIGSHTHFRSPLKCHLVRVLSLTSLYLSPLEHDCNDSKCFYRACHVLDISVSAILYVYSCIILATS